jgi:hypothetical protein
MEYVLDEPFQQEATQLFGCFFLFERPRGDVTVRAHGLFYLYLPRWGLALVVYRSSVSLSSMSRAAHSAGIK